MRIINSFFFRAPGTAFLILVLITGIAAGSRAADKEIGRLLRQASGVTDDDIDKASKKEALTLFDLYALAVRTTERLAIQGEYSLQAQAHKEEALGTFLPQVSLRAYKSFPPGSKHLATPASQSSGVYLYARQNILTGLDQWAGFSAASYEIKYQKYQLSYATGLLLQDVSSNFYLVVQQEKSLEIQKEILSLYNKTLAELRRRVAVGRSRESEVLRTNSQVFKLLAQIKALEDSLAGNRRSLATLTCMRVDSPLVAEVKVPDPDFIRDRMEEFIGRRWDVKAAAEQLEMARARVLAAWGGHLPSIYLEGSYRLAQFNKAGQSVPTRDYYAALGAEIPIFKGGITSAQVREAESIRRQAELGLSRTTREARQDILDSYENWLSSGQEMEAFKKALDSAKNNYRAVTEEYRLNLVTILDVLTSLTTLQGARDDYERTAMQHRFDRIRLGIALNEFPGSGLDRLRAPSAMK